MIVTLLNELVKKVVSFVWDDKQDKLTHALILVLPNFSIAFELECDTSKVAIGALLLQGRYLVAYFSEKLKGDSLSYLVTREFIIHIDHESVKYIRGQGKLNKKHRKWVEYLEQFLYVVKTNQESLMSLMMFYLHD